MKELNEKDVEQVSGGIYGQPSLLIECLECGNESWVWDSNSPCPKCNSKNVRSIIARN